jgi:heme-binding NEAT domain protein
LETKIKKKFSSSFTTKPVNLRFKNPQTIASLFEKYKQQVKIVNTNGLQDNRITEFAIKDCNGLLVLFTS